MQVWSIPPMPPAAVGCLCCKYSSKRLLDGCCARASVLLHPSCGGGGGGGDVNMQSGQQVQSRCWLAFVWTRLGKNWDGFGFLWEMFLFGVF